MRALDFPGLAGAFLVSGALLSAHHTVATVFDTEHLVKLQGRLAEVEWKNPHVVLHLDVTGADGSLIAWTVETLNLRGLTTKGLTADLCQRAAGFRSRDGRAGGSECAAEPRDVERHRIDCPFRA